MEDGEEKMIKDVKIEEIKTSLKSFEIYSLFKDRRNSFILDSGMDPEKLGRYSFIGFDPLLIFKSKEDKVYITKSDGTSIVTSSPFERLQEILNKYSFEYESELPFVGGAVGYLSYDLCHQIEELPRTAIDDVDIPDMFFGFYDGVVIVDHLEEKTYIAAIGIERDREGVIEDIKKVIETNNETKIKVEIRERKEKINIESNFTKDEYIVSLNKLKDYIKEGDIYQANLTQRFACDIDESPYDLYNRLRTINPAPFASFIDFGEGHIVSSSPERFIKIDKGVIETRPIKGTRPRGNTPEDDKLNREELLSSDKDKSELLMIVDLERNDIGRISEIGSVNVTELFHLEEYPTVYHLVSTIKGDIKKELELTDVLRATFPGGSITGAPKIRAMEIIDELEPTQRNIYTGSIGYIGFNGVVDLNIVIRTIICKDSRAYFQAGGGIVWDSDPLMEYEESLHKAKAMMRAINTL